MVGNRKGRWMIDEDRLLAHLVKEHSVDGEDIDWSVLEQRFKGARDSKQIRERWVNHLNPWIKKRKFSEEEIQIIEAECSKHKFKWARISKKIPNATPLMIKNFYNNRLKKKNPANRRQNNSTAITPYTINNFNHNAITSTTTTKPTINNTINTPNTPNTINITNNHNNYYDNNGYLQEKDSCYYGESNLRRSDSSKTMVSDEKSYPTKSMIVEGGGYTTSLTRNSSVRSVTSNSSIETVIGYDEHYSNHKILPSPPLPSPPLPSALEIATYSKGDGNLNILATVANIFGQNEPSYPTVLQAPKKSEKMSINNLICS